jgi:hypothetical protein
MVKKKSDAKPIEPDDDLFSEEEIEFIPCSRCDGHQACEDFGCAYEFGLSRMVKKDLPPGVDDWS